MSLLPSQVEPGIRKIAVLRANALGDFIFALPALAALRCTYPAAEIVFLAKSWHQQFLAERPSPVDRVVVIPPDSVETNPKNPQEERDRQVFFEAMRREKFDLAIQMHGGGRNSNPFVQRLGARLTIGLRTPDAPPLDRWVPYEFYQPEIFRYLEVVSLVGAKTHSWEPQIFVTNRDRAESCRVVPDREKPLVALHPGASDSRRRWSAEKFAAVADLLVQAGADLVVTGTEQEKNLAEAVIAYMNQPGQDIAGQLSLGGLAGLLSRCRLVVSNDTGPLHLARAVGTPTVGIYWCGNLITAGALTRSLHRPVMSWRLNCPVCGLDCTRHSCPHRVSFVDEVTVEEVTHAALDLLLNWQQKPAPTGVDRFQIPSLQPIVAVDNQAGIELRIVD